MPGYLDQETTLSRPLFHALLLLSLGQLAFDIGVGAVGLLATIAGAALVIADIAHTTTTTTTRRT